MQWYDDGTLGPATMAGKPDVANGAFDGEYLLTFQGPWFYTGNKEEDIAKVQSGLLPAGEAGSPVRGRRREPVPVQQRHQAGSRVGLPAS